MMLEHAEPDCQATIFPEMVALMRALVSEPFADGAGRPENLRPREPSTFAASGKISAPDRSGACASVDRPKWPVVSLRRDGRRPLVFEGVRVFSWQQTVAVEVQNAPGTMERHGAVFIERSGSLVLHLRCEPSDGMPARAVHRVFRCADAAAFAESLATSIESCCFDVTPGCRVRIGAVPWPSGLQKIGKPTDTNSELQE